MPYSGYTRFSTHGNVGDSCSYLLDINGSAGIGSVTYRKTLSSKNETIKKTGNYIIRDDLSDKELSAQNFAVRISNWVSGSE